MDCSKGWIPESDSNPTTSSELDLGEVPTPEDIQPHEGLLPSSDCLPEPGVLSLSEPKSISELLPRGQHVRHCPLFTASPPKSVKKVDTSSSPCTGCTCGRPLDKVMIFPEHSVTIDLLQTKRLFSAKDPIEEMKVIRQFHSNQHMPVRVITRRAQQYEQRALLKAGSGAGSRIDGDPESKDLTCERK